MTKLGIVGGLGPASTVYYYEQILKLYAKQKGGDYPEILIASLNLKKSTAILEKGDLAGLADYLLTSVESLAKAGAELVVIASNTPHIVFGEVASRSSVKLLSIVEETCKKAKSLKLKKLGLLGTKFTMQADFYQNIFSKEKIEIVIPGEQERSYIHDKIMSELESGKIQEETRKGLLNIIKRMGTEDSIQGVILGCTELPLILTTDEFGIYFLNTAKIHIESTLRYIC